MGRPAAPAAPLSLPAIEAAAGEAVRSIGMPGVADDTLPDIERVTCAASDGRLWVATVHGNALDPSYGGRGFSDFVGRQIDCQG